jgi:hypothetical protein
MSDVNFAIWSVLHTLQINRARLHDPAPSTIAFLSLSLTRQEKSYQTRVRDDSLVAHAAGNTLQNVLRAIAISQVFSLTWNLGKHCGLGSRAETKGYVNSTLPFGPLYLWDSVCRTSDAEVIRTFRVCHVDLREVFRPRVFVPSKLQRTGACSRTVASIAGICIE